MVNKYQHAVDMLNGHLKNKIVHILLLYISPVRVFLQ